MSYWKRAAKNKRCPVVCIKVKNGHGHFGEDYIPLGVRKSGVEEPPYHYVACPDPYFYSPPNPLFYAGDWYHSTRLTTLGGLTGCLERDSRFVKKAHQDTQLVIYRHWMGVADGAHNPYLVFVLGAWREAPYPTEQDRTDVRRAEYNASANCDFFASHPSIDFLRAVRFGLGDLNPGEGRKGSLLELMQLDQEIDCDRRWRG